MLFAPKRAAASGVAAHDAAKSAPPNAVRFFFQPHDRQELKKGQVFYDDASTRTLVHLGHVESMGPTHYKAVCKLQHRDSVSKKKCFFLRY